MKIKRLEEKIVLPEGVTAVIDEETLTLNGQKGQVSKLFRDVFIKMNVEGNNISIFAENATKRQKRMIGTFKSHVKNMIKGVKDGFTYKLKICSGHFPMNVTFNNGEFSIKNFIGEKIPRTLKVPQAVNVKIEGNDIVVVSPDKELAGQTAGSIEGLTRRPGFDTRIFQSGIYITEKAGKDIKG
ncbi:50S ribosomal protein L6 [Candidatus Woesearchaeota archaeon CG11_big_fil_rev_8_21_14_0_20_43_8]|nr:MAG: 50S ribosomal protein L6 [Candidatus Woesearchaeota archaeon CG11_big_fil_rev_8_21_14_0_20_43_8]PIO08940.1 MAG: 50S ribosomal protein L6 [Candidatus Woesearchaeota archaeon CG08_land_8_20_14_0_20_43_7]